MKRLIAIITIGFMLTLGCAHQSELTEEEKQKYRRARQTYNAGQDGP